MIELPSATITEAVNEYLEAVKNPENYDREAVALSICDTIEEAIDNGEASGGEVSIEVPKLHTASGRPELIYVDVTEWM